MKNTFYIILLLSFALQLTFAQEGTLSIGKVPSMKIERMHIAANQLDNPTNIAYGHSSLQNITLSMPIPAGTPFTYLSTWYSGNFAPSMCKGCDGYYLIDVTPALYSFDEFSGIVQSLGSITGMSGDQPTGIGFNPADRNYYIVSATNFYSFDIETRVATLIGSLNLTSGGLMIDLCFDLSGTCYAYEVNVSAANAYTINITTGNATAIGTLGYEPNYGQGMSYDFETNTIYLSAFNGGTMTGQLRTMDPATGLTTLITDWGFEQIAPFVIANNGMILCPCWIGDPSNPNPPSGSTNISVTGTTLSWTNGVYTTLVEVWFGLAGGITKVYDGPVITSYPLPTLDYETNYQWRIVCKNDTCSTYGPNWSFTTMEDPNLIFEIVEVYPLNMNYWTGTCDSISKTQTSLVNAYSNELGWMVFDLSPIVNWGYVVIEEIVFNGYLYANNWPYWSITPMGSINPITSTAADIFNQVSNSYMQGTAYGFFQESGTLTNGWIQKDLADGTIYIDLINALNQGWFAIGIVDWDFSSSYYVEFEGWAEDNKPYLTVQYYIIPVELTSFTAEVENNVVTLFWQTATETNNSGFEVERLQDSKIKKLQDWKTIAFVPGFGTTTKPKAYSFVDMDVTTGIYKYRLKQIDFDGSFEYSQEIEAEVKAPNVFSLEQNYPNPFNPSTVISYQLPVNGNVTLKVYDILGNEVATLVNEEKQAGTYKLTWNPEKLPSGIYFYQINAGSFVDAKKMVLIK